MSEERNEEKLKEMLGEAYAAADAPDGLRDRVAAMANSIPVGPRPRRVLPPRLALVGALMLLVGGALAFRYLFNRPGETAIQLIPADALIVATLDTNPSPAQVPLYARIEKAMQNRGVAGKAEAAIGKLVEDSGIASTLRPYLGHNLALAILSTGGAPKEMFDGAVLLLELKDRAGAEAALKQRGRRAFEGSLTYYRLGKEPYCVTEFGPYLAITQKPALLGRIADVAESRVPSVATLREYQLARAELPEDANLMLFVSPAALSEVNEKSKTIGVNPLRHTQWMAASATLRDEGVQVDFRVPVNDPRVHGGPAPLDEQLLHKLPAGPYGIEAIAQPAWYWSSSEEKDAAELRKEMGELEKQSGLNLERDVLPGLQGDVVLAVYPAEGKEASVDGLVVFSDAHGADAALLAEKVRGAIERATQENGKPGIRFRSTPSATGAVWHLDGDTAKGLREAVHDAVGEGAQAASPYELVHATVGKAVLIASSQSMLDRAIAAWSGGARSVADDPSYPLVQTKSVAQAQWLLTVELHAILERLRPYLKKEMDKTDPEDLVRLFGGEGSALVVSGRFDGQLMKGTLFVPLEYERAVNLLSGPGW